MPNVIICRGRDIEAQVKWAEKKSSLIVDTFLIREMLSGKKRNTKVTDRLVLSIRDTIMVRCLRVKRNVILIGEHNLFPQIERIDEVLTAQGEIDGKKYTWKVKEIK